MAAAITRLINLINQLLKHDSDPAAALLYDSFV